MEQPRYQVFISSPTRGLEEARNAIIRSVLHLNWIPAAMEFFPLPSGSTWELIRKLIDQSDYFVVLLGGRVGTLFDGKSITEMEYDYALQQEIPIARFVHDKPDALPDTERDMDTGGQIAFRRLREKLTSFGTPCVRWSTHEELVEKVAPGLTQLRQAHARTGWIRTTRAGLIESLEKNGITHVYATRDEALGDMLVDIQSSSKSCWISAAVYVDKLIKSDAHRDLGAALKQAGIRAGENKTQYRLTFCSLSDDISEQSLAGQNNAALLECWSRREQTQKIATLLARIETGSSAFEDFARYLAASTSGIRPERRFFRDYLVPHSLVVIDESIAYVSFYDWGTSTGRLALTIRSQGGFWGDKFVEESRIIRSRFSYRDYRVIAFDFDGVIANSMGVQADAWRQAAQRVDIPWEVREHLLTNFWRGAAGRRMFEQIALNDELLMQLRKIKDATFARLEPTVSTFENSAQVLRSLKEAGHHKLTIVTTASKKRVQEFLERHSLAEYFDHIITDADVSYPKPHPDMLLKTAAHFDCQPWQICVVGDTVTDYDMSEGAGTDFVLLETHPEHGAPVECAKAETWRELEKIFIGRN